MNAQYRGFDIALKSGDVWSARITNAKTGRAWSQEPSTPLDGGVDACMRRATNLVDAFLALHGTR